MAFPVFLEELTNALKCLDSYRKLIAWNIHSSDRKMNVTLTWNAPLLTFQSKENMPTENVTEGKERRGLSCPAATKKHKKRKSLSLSKETVKGFVSSGPKSNNSRKIKANQT